MTSISKIDTSETTATYLWTCSNGVYLKLSPSAYHLLQCVESGMSFAEIADALSCRQGITVSPQKVALAHQQLREQIDASERRNVQMPAEFWFQVPLLPASIVAAIAQRLAPLFNPCVGVLLALAALVAHMLALHNGLMLHYAPVDYWQGYALYLVAIVAHELGHASACARYGARPNAIGFSVYWMFPVFYADVSTAWTLKRWQRVLVDLGGAYFQLLVGGVFAIAYLQTAWLPFQVALLMSVFNSFFILNPILKFDGYWVVADSLGVTNLAQQPRRIWRHYVDRLHRRAVVPLPWPPAIVLALTIYTLGSFSFWVYYGLHLILFLWSQVVAYPESVRRLTIAATVGSYQALLDAAAGLLTSTVMLIFAVVLARRLVWEPLHVGVRTLHKRWQNVRAMPPWDVL